MLQPSEDGPCQLRFPSFSEIQTCDDENDGFGPQNTSTEVATRPFHFNTRCSSADKVNSTPRKRARCHTHVSKQRTVNLQGWVKKLRELRRNEIRSARRARLTKKRKKNKSVQFHEDTKSWDGIRYEHKLMQQLITNYWNKDQSTTLISNLLANVKKAELDSLNSLLKDLLRRLHSCVKSVPLLPGGGGKAFKLARSHIPHIEYLQRITYQACLNCEQCILANMKLSTEVEGDAFQPFDFDLLGDQDLQEDANMF